MPNKTRRVVLLQPKKGGYSCSDDILTAQTTFILLILKSGNVIWQEV